MHNSLHNLLKLPSLWLSEWKQRDPFAEIFHLDGKVFREQSRRKTLSFTKDNESYFLKLHYGVGYKEIIKNLMAGKSPVIGAKNELVALTQLMPYGFVPKIIGYGFKGNNPAFQQSFIITESLTYTQTLEDYCRDWLVNPPDLEFKRALIRRVAEIAKTIHAQGINHRDFYLCHFLLNIAGGKNFLEPCDIELYVIDWHRAQSRHKVPLRWRVKDIAGLYFSAMDIGLTQRDLWRFMKIYEGGTDKAFWKKVEKRAIQLYRKINRKCALNIFVPFYLSFKKDTYLIAKKLLRAMPKKRMVFYGEWNSQEIVAKAFVKKKHAIAEIKGFRALQKKGFLTPHLLHADYTQHNTFYAVVFEHIKQAKNLGDFFEESSLEEKKVLFEKLWKLIHALHDAGLYQRDLHLNNFLLDKDNNIYIIDCGSLKIQANSLTHTQRIKNLALLLAQFPEENAFLWQAYQTSDIVKEIKKQRDHICKKFLKKTLRNCTAYKKEKHADYHFIKSRAHDNQALNLFLQELIKNSLVIHEKYKVDSFVSKKIADYFYSPAKERWLELQQKLFEGAKKNIPKKDIPIVLIEKKIAGIITTHSYLVTLKG